ncbi:MAG: phytoene desaturase family protein [Acidimicrobiia bacterium]
MAAADYDVVVAGAGHNSLIAAAYLAKAGLRCLVLEGRPVIGGDTATEELTLPGFLHDSCSTAHNLIQASPTMRNNELGLDRYGLEYIRPDPVVHVPFPDGTSITMWRDLEATVAEFGRFSTSDASSYRRMMEEYDQVKAAFGGARYTPIDFGPGLEQRLASGTDGGKWMRRIRESAWDVIRREFEDDHTRAFMLWMAFMTLQPPERPGTGSLAYSLTYGRQSESWIIPHGGSGALPLALTRFLEDRGSAVLANQRVSSLILEGGRCVGVETASGESFRAKQAVLSTIHVKHLIDMAPAGAWDDDFRFGVETWRAGVSMMPAHYATKTPPTFATRHGPVSPVAAGIPVAVERMLRIGFDHLRASVALDDPPLLVLCPTVADPGRAPSGHHTLKVIGFQPYELADGPEHWDAIREKVADVHLDHLRLYSPNLTRDSILGSNIKSPLDLERMNPHNWHGSCHGGDQDGAQSGALRPAPGWAQHRMPIPGLYQTGSTTHPGASVSGGPGRNAAWVLLTDLGFDFQQVASGA